MWTSYSYIYIKIKILENWEEGDIDTPMAKQMILFEYYNIFISVLPVVAKLFDNSLFNNQFIIFLFISARAFNYFTDFLKVFYRRKRKIVLDFLFKKNCSK